MENCREITNRIYLITTAAYWNNKLYSQKRRKENPSPRSIYLAEKKKCFSFVVFHFFSATMKRTFVFGIKNSGERRKGRRASWWGLKFELNKFSHYNASVILSATFSCYIISMGKIWIHTFMLTKPTFEKGIRLSMFFSFLHDSMVY